jgi:uncharacterized protein DUF4190
MSSPWTDPGAAGFSGGYTPGPLPGLPTSPYDTYPAGVVYSRARNALVLGILALPLSILTGIPAILVGRHALRIIDESDGALQGRRSAWCGIVLGFLSVAVAVVFLVRTYLT